MMIADIGRDMQNSIQFFGGLSGCLTKGYSRANSPGWRGAEAGRFPVVRLLGAFGGAAEIAVAEGDAISDDFARRVR